MAHLIGNLRKYERFKQTVASSSPRFEIGDVVELDISHLNALSIVKVNNYFYPTAGVIEILKDGKLHRMSRGLISGRVKDAEVRISPFGDIQFEYVLEFKFADRENKYEVSHVKEEFLVATSNNPDLNEFVPDRRIVSIDYHYEDGEIITRKI